MRDEGKKERRRRRSWSDWYKKAPGQCAWTMGDVDLLLFYIKWFNKKLLSSFEAPLLSILHNYSILLKECPFSDPKLISY